MAVFLRGKTYWYKFKFKGRRIEESARTRNRRTAEQIENARKTSLALEAAGLKPLNRKPAPTLKAAIDAFLAWSATQHSDKPNTTKRYQTSAKAVLRAFNSSTGIADITPDDIKEYIKKRSRQSPLRRFKTKKTEALINKFVQPATINRELALLRAVFNHHKKDVPVSPMDGIKFLKEESEPVILSPPEIQQYFAEASQPLADIARLILDTGMRPDEVYGMEVANVNLAQSVYFNKVGKTKAARRRVPLTARARDIVRRRCEQAKDLRTAYLFPGDNDTSRHIVKVNAAHYGALRRSGVRHFRLYDLRHMFATFFAEATGDLITLAAILGHSKLDMVMRYSHPTDRHKKTAMQRAEDYEQQRYLDSLAELRGKQIAQPVELARVPLDGGTNVATVIPGQDEADFVSD